jgi:Gpi18-like mannosyltransferase
MRDIKKARIELALLFLLFIFIMPTRHMVYDFEFWVNWALKIHQDGITNVYDDPTVNYHPGFLYLLGLYDLIQGSEFYIRENINYIKFFPLIFDFLPVVVLCCFRQRFIGQPIPYLFLLLNIAYLFNTMCWGQVDSIHTNLIFLSLLLAIAYPVASMVLFMLALGTKLQTIVFLPLLVILYVYSVRNIKQALGVAIAAVLTIGLVLTPFIVTGKMPQLWNVVTGAVGFYPKVSVNAFNLWYIIEPDNPYFINDSETYFLLSYKHIGLLLFFIMSGLTLLPLFLRTLRLRKAGQRFGPDTKQLLFLTTGLIALYFFYFNTQMHERYAHPIIIFFFFYAVYSKDYKLYILGSIAYLLSLDKTFQDYLPIVHYKIIFASRVIAIWYTITITYGIYIFFKQYSIRKEYRLLKSQG